MFAILKTPQPNPSLPWYKNYMVTLFVIGLPLVMVVLCIYLVMYSFKHADSTVRDDWYMDGKTLYADVSKDKLAHDMGLMGNMAISSSGDVQFQLDNPAIPTNSPTNPMSATATTPFIKPKTLMVNLSHATQKDKDRDMTLTLNANGSYQGKVNLAEGVGKYYIVVHDEANTWRLRNISQLPSDKPLKFAPLHAFDSNADTVSDTKPSDVKIDERKKPN